MRKQQQHYQLPSPTFSPTFNRIAHHTQPKNFEHKTLRPAFDIQMTTYVRLRLFFALGFECFFMQKSRTVKLLDLIDLGMANELCCSKRRDEEHNSNIITKESLFF